MDGPVRIALQSGLLANEQLPEQAGDPRVAAALTNPLASEFNASEDSRAILVHSTRASGLRIGAAMDHLVSAPSPVQIASSSYTDSAEVTATVTLQPGERLELIKFVSYGWSSTRSLPAVRDQVRAALTTAVQTGWDGLLAEQRGYLDDFWDRADVQIDGDTEIQQAVRFGLFHVLQAGARAENRAIPAKGLTGPGYDGHAFWDTETFVLGALALTVPDAAAAALRWRHSTLPLALDRAKQLGLKGAAFPWRTIAGQECSAYWPACTAAFHINADIADAAIRYVLATGDEDFRRGIGLELLIHTARLWRSLGHHDAGGQFHIDGVTGPDEYSAVADDNVYTNLMAAQNMKVAADWAQQDPDRARELGINAEEMAAWRDAAAAMAIPYDEEMGVHPQSAGFTRHARWDFEACGEEQYPLFLHFPYFDLYRKQVIKQADLVLAMQLCPGSFTAEQKASELRLLRVPDRAGLVAVRVHPGGARGRGGPPRAGLRLPRRGRPDGPARPGEQHQGRGAHRVAGRDLGRAGGRVRRAAALRQRDQLRPAAARRAVPAGLHGGAARPAAAGHGHRGQRPLPAGGGRPAGDHAPRHGGNPAGRPAEGAPDPGSQGPPAPPSRTAGPRVRRAEHAT